VELVEAITIVQGPISVLERDDVDTDQIIPKQFLKRVERTSSTTGRRSRAGSCRRIPSS
jgi:3-isopropylmalate dehydratase small subunit